MVRRRALNGDHGPVASVIGHSLVSRQAGRLVVFQPVEDLLAIAGVDDHPEERGRR